MMARDQRRRHRAVGHRRQVARRAGAPPAGWRLPPARSRPMPPASTACAARARRRASPTRPPAGRRTAFRAMKVKLGFGIDDDLAVMHAVREALEGEAVTLMIDTNHAYGVADAIRLGRALEDRGCAGTRSRWCRSDPTDYRAVRRGARHADRRRRERVHAVRLPHLLSQDAARRRAARPVLAAAASPRPSTSSRWRTRRACRSTRTSGARRSARPPRCSGSPSIPVAHHALYAAEPVFEYDTSSHPFRSRLVKEPVLRARRLDRAAAPPGHRRRGQPRRARGIRRLGACLVPVHNADIARIFEEIADLLEIQDANPFRVRAYRNAARVVGEQRFDIAERLAKDEALPKLPGIGEDLARKIAKSRRAGPARCSSGCAKRAPAGITELLQLPGLGPKRVRTLYHELDVHRPRAAGARRERRAAARAPRLRREDREDAARCRARPARHHQALQARRRGRVREASRRAPGERARRGERGGRRQLPAHEGDGGRPRHPGHRRDDGGAGRDAALRRRTARSRRCWRRARRAPASVLASGLQVDLRVVPSESAGAALHYFTGSKAHNIALRRMAQERGLKINEYGVFRGERSASRARPRNRSTRRSACPGSRPSCARTAARSRRRARATLPRLVELDDLRGDLHVHTKATDGRHTPARRWRGGRRRGARATSRSPSTRAASPWRTASTRSGSRARLRRSTALNAKLKGITLLKGIEVDILEDGALDLPDAALEPLDLVVGAVHSRFELSRARQTERILAAMDIAVPFDPRAPDRAADRRARALRRRHAGDRAQGAGARLALELNAHPERLDLTDVHCQMAKDEGVLVASTRTRTASTTSTTCATASARRGAAGWRRATC